MPNGGKGHPPPEPYSPPHSFQDSSPVSKRHRAPHRQSPSSSGGQHVHTPLLSRATVLNPCAVLQIHFTSPAVRVLHRCAPKHLESAPFTRLREHAEPTPQRGFGLHGQGTRTAVPPTPKSKGLAETEPNTMCQEGWPDRTKPARKSGGSALWRNGKWTLAEMSHEGLLPACNVWLVHGNRGG